MGPPDPPFAPAKPAHTLSCARETAAEETFLPSLSSSFCLCNEKNNLSLLDLKTTLFCQSPTPTSSSAGWTVPESSYGGEACLMPVAFPPSFPGAAVKLFLPLWSAGKGKGRGWLQGHGMVCSPRTMEDFGQCLKGKGSGGIFRKRLLPRGEAAARGRVVP